MKMLRNNESCSLSIVGVALASTVLALGATGCSAADETATPSASASVALFQDPATSGPRLDVYDSGGEATIAVSGPIGTEAALRGLTGQESLTDIYRALHPEVATVPSELVALDEQLGPKLAALRAQPRAATDAAPALIEKSESAFNSAVCKNFVEGSARYTVKYCNWGLACGVTTNWAKPQILPGDRTYAGITTTSHRLCSGSCQTPILPWRAR
jgi:hypothetical protein